MFLTPSSGGLYLIASQNYNAIFSTWRFVHKICKMCCRIFMQFQKDAACGALIGYLQLCWYVDNVDMLCSRWQSVMRYKWRCNFETKVDVTPLKMVPSRFVRTSHERSKEWCQLNVCDSNTRQQAVRTRGMCNALHSATGQAALWPGHRTEAEPHKVLQKRSWNFTFVFYSTRLEARLLQ